MRKVKFTKKKAGLLLIIMILFCVTACGKQSNKTASISTKGWGNDMAEQWEMTSEKRDVIKRKLPYSQEKLQEQICQQSEVFQSYQDLKLVSFEITGRRTSIEDGTDSISCKVEAETGDFTYSANIALIYILYDQGWLLDDMIVSDEIYLPLQSTVTQEMADAMAATLDFDEVVADGRQTFLEDGADVFYYQAKEYNGYWVVESFLMLIYEFDPEQGWVYKEYDFTTDSEHWNLEKLCGTWRTEQAGMDGYFEITIENIDSDNRIVSGFYSCDINGVGLTQRLIRDEAGDFVFNDDWWYLVGGSMFERFGIEIDKRHGVIFGNQYCGKVN